MVVESFIFVTAVLYTMIGYSFGRKKANYELVEKSVAATIDKLVDEGYIKTVGTGNSMILLKYDSDDKTS